LGTRPCTPKQRYWLKARDGNHHPDEFAEPHVVDVLSRCGGRGDGSGQPPEALHGAAPRGGGAADAAPLLGYAFAEYEAPARSGNGAAAAPQDGAAAASSASARVLAVAVCSSGLSLDTLAACDGEARGTLVRAPRRAPHASLEPVLTHRLAPHALFPAAALQPGSFAA
jgi:hypothetical protein